MLVRRGELIGKGGMAEVYRGEVIHDRAGGAAVARQVAIKCIRPTTDNCIGRLFEREARIAAALSHPNIVSLLDVTQDDKKQPILIMELVEGIALSRLVGTPRPQPVIVYIGIQLFQALAHAHGRGVMHRDISPHNVLISLAGEVKLTDFGLSTIAGSDDTTLVGSKGKAGYMSPEQAYGTDIDSRADLFAVGIMLYELATGALPFDGDCVPQFVVRLLDAPLTPPRILRPDIQPELEAIILGLLERDRDKRFASADDVLDALAVLPAAGAGELARLVADTANSQDTRAAQFAPRTHREHLTASLRPRPSRRSWLAAAAIALGLLAGLLHATLLYDRTSPPSAPAELADERPTPDSAAVPEPAFEPPATPPEPAAATLAGTHEPPPVAAVPRPAMRAAKASTRLPRKAYTRPPESEPIPARSAETHSGIDYPAAERQSGPFDIYVAPIASR